MCARADGVCIAQTVLLNAYVDFFGFAQIDPSFNPSALSALFKRMMSDIQEERPTMAEALKELRKITLETLVYPDRHAFAIVKGDQDEVAAEGTGIPVPASPAQD